MAIGHMFMAAAIHSWCLPCPVTSFRHVPSHNIPEAITLSFELQIE